MALLPTAPRSGTPTPAASPAAPSRPPATQSPEQAQEEAQRASDSLKSQIAAVRDRVREARETLAGQARREALGKSLDR